MGQNAEEQFLNCFRKATVFKLTNYPVFTITGLDAVRYLHGRLTNNMKALKPGEGARSLMLSPQGRVDGHVRVLRLADSFLIISDPVESSQSFAERLFRYKVADQVEVKENLGNVILSVQGPEAKRVLGLLLVTVAPEAQALKHTYDAGMAIAYFPRGAVANGYDCVLTAKLADEQLAKLKRYEAEGQFLFGNEESFEMLRIASGIPLFGKDINDRTIAAELELDELVSFNKGCYVGQEVVEKASSRGKTSRKLRLLMAEESIELSTGGTLTAKENGGEEAGEVTGSFTLPQAGRTFVLATVKVAHGDNPLYCNGTRFQHVTGNTWAP